MQLKVVLPSGEVTVPVEPNSTPGHLKENLKYSLRVPPKQIRLTCEGRELDDIKPLAGEPNNVKDNAIVIADRKDGVPEDDGPKTDTTPIDKPIMIKKDEPPKPPKIKKDVVRPSLKEGDVVKVKTLKHGGQGWAPSNTFLQEKNGKRHLAFVRIEVGAAAALAPEMPVRLHGLKAKPELNGKEGCLVKFDAEKGRWQTRVGSGKAAKMLEIKPDNLESLAKGNKTYPEDTDGTIVFALGDPHTSPAWTAAAMELDIGERAEFTMSQKVIDFDPMGLCPSDASKTWIVELVQLREAFDLNQDFTQLVYVEKAGGPDIAQELDSVAVHWRFRRWMAEGSVCIGSSRERIAIMPGYGLVPIEDQNAAPVSVSIGEGQQEGIEAVAARVGQGGVGHIYLKPDAMKSGRPGGCVVIDVELVALDPNRGPGSPGWKGWQSLFGERSKGDHWLEEADGARKQLETFETLHKSTDQTKDSEANHCSKVHKCANNAARRYRRALHWIEAEDRESKKIKTETFLLEMRLAKALALSQKRFGDAAENEASADEKKILEEARKLLGAVLANADGSENEILIYECLVTTLQVCIQEKDVAEARTVVERLTALRPDEADDLKSEIARINRLENTLNLKKGAGMIETVQQDLRTAITDQDKPKIAELLTTIHTMLVESQVTWDTVRNLKVGKDVGNAMKMGDPELAAKARNCVQEIQSLAQRAGIGL